MIARRLGNSFFGWRVTAAAFVLAMFAWGISFYGPPIFLEVLHVSRGWSVSLLSAAITAHFLLGALVVANLASLHRRFGIAAITRAGIVLTAIGLVGWGLVRAPWQLFLVMPLSGAGWAMTGGAALNAMISPWFVRRRPAALGLAFNGASMGGVLFSPLWVVLIGRLGFPAAAILVSVVAVAAVWLLADRYLAAVPAAMGLAPDGEDRTAATPVRAAPGAATLDRPWRDRRFVTLTAAATLALVAQIGLVAHLFLILAPTLGEGGAGLTLGAATACAILGRSLLGAVMRPDSDRRVVAAANVGLQAAGSVLLLCAGSSVPLLLLGCGLFGLGLGNVTSLPPLIAQSEFTAADAPRVVALVTATSQAGYAFAPALFGALRDVGGAEAGVPLLFATAAIVQLAAAAAALLGRRRGATAAAVLPA